jgi:hypothetical protein
MNSVCWGNLLEGTTEESITSYEPPNCAWEAADINRNNKLKKLTYFLLAITKFYVKD